MFASEIATPHLPSINSDDGDQQDREYKGMKPSWAQTPALRAAIAAQQQKAPEAIFGTEIRAVNLEECFRKKDSQR